MSTIEQTVSMLEAMPEEARVLVFRYTQELFTSTKPASPFKPLSAEDVLAELAVSRSQIANGEGVEMKSALVEMGKRHGFV